MCGKCSNKSCDGCNADSYNPNSSSALKYDGPKFECSTKFTVLPGEPLNDIINTLMERICLNANSGFVESVTGLNTNNADPQNPIIQISVDGVTITGSGTPADPLVAGVPIPQIIDFTIVNPRTFSSTNEIPGISVISPALAGTYKGATDPFLLQIDRMGFLEAVVISIETPPAAATNFIFGRLPSGISYPTAQDYLGGQLSTINVEPGESRYFNNVLCFAWASLPIGQHEVVLRFVSDPITGIPDKLLSVFLIIS